MVRRGALSMADSNPTGGEFLLRDVGQTRIMAPEQLSAEQKAYWETAHRFSRTEVLPKSAQLEKKDFGLMRDLLKKAGEIGLLGIEIPEAYGGLGLGVTTSCLVAEAKTLYGSWSVTFGGHTGIGSLPMVWYGTPAQKEKYLPRVATGECVCAYALTESVSGSDALGARTKAVKSADGKHWVLNGSKQFITNAGFADLFMVFAKVDGEKFTCFIVERGTPGLTVGPEEHKMGLRGSSTCPLVFEDARVPIDNVLGEIGKGHKIAFNVLNHGRLKLGVGVLGGMKLQLEHVVAYARDRKQFSTPIVKFGLIREKLARMAVATYATESMAYRTAGLIDARMEGEDKNAADHDAKTQAAIEQYAIEASILKVFGSEALGLVSDDAVQIHGGYGYIEEYPVERAYRDARINRIFEGTNEINRMLITGMLLKRTMKGELPTFDVAGTIAEELDSKALPKARGNDALALEALAAEYLKRIALYCLKAAAETFGLELEKQQVVLSSLSDLIMDVFALDSMITRTRQATSAGTLDATRVAIIRLFSNQAHARGFESARRVLTTSGKADAIGKLQALQLFNTHSHGELLETVASAVESAGGYPFPIA
ncbi:MAG: acyl-CoA dehydrogenase family protein [Archangiaceae bacterium]|nr:acyl-CoA dehydrogenase family protein [Archangiaceae bacterium]